MVISTIAVLKKIKNKDSSAAKEGKHFYNGSNLPEQTFCTEFVGQ
jgi:hypothetical protein